MPMLDSLSIGSCATLPATCHREERSDVAISYPRWHGKQTPRWLHYVRHDARVCAGKKGALWGAFVVLCQCL